MYLKAAKIPPGGRLRRGSGQSAWDYPQGSRLFARERSTAGSRLLHLGSAVALGVHLSVHCVGFD